MFWIIILPLNILYYPTNESIRFSNNLIFLSLFWDFGLGLGAVLGISAVSATFSRLFSGFWAWFGELFWGFLLFQLLFAGFSPAFWLSLGCFFSTSSVRSLNCLFLHSGMRIFYDSLMFLESNNSIQQVIPILTGHNSWRGGVLPHFFVKCSSTVLSRAFCFFLQSGKLLRHRFCLVHWSICVAIFPVTRKIYLIKFPNRMMKTEFKAQPFYLSKFRFWSSFPYFTSIS